MVRATCDLVIRKSRLTETSFMRVKCALASRIRSENARGSEMNKMGNWIWGGTALVCLVLLFGSPIRAQETADVIGTVTDVSGGVLPGATVTLTNTGTGISQTTQTAADGDYVFTLLQVGNYSVKVEAKGFKTFVTPSVALSAADRARVDAKMEVGAQTTTVEVSAAIAPALQTDSSQIGALVTSQNVEDLPLNNRNLVKLVQLTPGVTEGETGSIAAGNRSNDARLTSAFSANGQNDIYNNNLVDGVDNNERSVGVIGVRPSIDAIQEVNVQTNKYDASSGHTGGAVVDVITKSGTNNFHGSAYRITSGIRSLTRIRTGRSAAHRLRIRHFAKTTMALASEARSGKTRLSFLPIGKYWTMRRAPVPQLLPFQPTAKRV